MKSIHDLWEPEEALKVISGFLVHYGFEPIIDGDTLWEEELVRIVALLRHMEDVLPAPLPGPDEKPHPLYPERSGVST